jgi:hypothetical protein
MGYPDSTGTWGKRWSTQKASVSVIQRPKQEGELGAHEFAFGRFDEHRA